MKDLSNQQWCKGCESWQGVGEFREGKGRCDTCRRASNRKFNKTAKRREYFREHQAKMRAAHRLMPEFLAVAQALIDGKTELAERIAKHAYVKALQEGIA